MATSSSPAGLAGAALVPLAFLTGVAFVSARAPFRSATLASGLGAGLALFAVELGALGRLGGPAGGRPAPGLDAWLELDLVTSAMLALVTGLGAVVVRYSRTYLAREAGLARYERSLLLLLASVATLVTSRHLGVIAVAWFGTSAALHQLLTFHPSRTQALVAAHKKFLLSRLADTCFVAALVLLHAETATLRVDELGRAADEAGGLSGLAHLATVLLVSGVLLKSAQLPFHGWMTQVMEAPTPVSALLHAGVVNIGGFVLIRLAGLMAHAPYAQALLLGVGLLTALVGSLVMLTRVSVKVALAWHLALLHLLAHSAYKAHAFLGAGGAVEAWRRGSLVALAPASARAVLAGTGLALG